MHNSTMQHALYSEMARDNPSEARRREKQAFDHAIDLMATAERSGSSSQDARDAIFFLEEFWSILMDDLAQEESDLPERLRASLISIGIFVLKETGRIRAGVQRSFSGLIEINAIIRDGLH